MGFFASLTRDSRLRVDIGAGLGDRYALAWSSSWDRLLHLVKERPVTGVILDGSGARGRTGCVLGAVTELRHDFPSLPVVFVVPPGADPRVLLKLGRTGLEGLVVGSPGEVRGTLPRVCAEAYRKGTASLVTSALSPYLPWRETRTLRSALDGVIQGWSAERLATVIGLSRPHLSERLKGAGLPSAGHLLVWARLLHAGRWLEDPGRSAESISRQLEYSSGAALRRALRNYLGTTPTETVEAGGFRFVLERFLDSCTVDRDRSTDRTAA